MKIVSIKTYVAITVALVFKTDENVSTNTATITISGQALDNLLPYLY